MILFFSMALAILVTFFVLQPYTRVEVVPEQLGNLALHKHQDLLDERERCLRELAELELDRNMNKISPEEYVASRNAVTQEFRVILDQLDSKG